MARARKYLAGSHFYERAHMLDLVDYLVGSLATFNPCLPPIEPVSMKQKDAKSRFQR